MRARAATFGWVSAGYPPSRTAAIAASIRASRRSGMNVRLFLAPSLVGVPTRLGSLPRDFALGSGEGGSTAQTYLSFEETLNEYRVFRTGAGRPPRFGHRRGVHRPGRGDGRDVVAERRHPLHRPVHPRLADPAVLDHRRLFS